MIRSRLQTRIAALTVLFVVALLTAACHSSSDNRVIIPTSDPRVDCPPVEGPRASKDAESAIAHAKGAISSVYDKGAHSALGSPADIARFEPYMATLKDGVWHVEGTIPAEYHGPVPITSVCRNDEGATVEWVAH